MSAPQPRDPLDEPIYEFVAAVKAFLSTPAPDVDQPAKADTGNSLEDLKQNWASVIDLSREVITGALPEIAERLRVIIEVGGVVLSLTKDPHIVGPVESVMELASAQRDDIESCQKSLAKGKSLIGAIRLIAELSAIGKRNAPRKKQIETSLDSLTAYYLLEGPNDAA